MHITTSLLQTRAVETAGNKQSERRPHEAHASVCPGSTLTLASEQTRSPAEFDWPAAVPRASKCLHSLAYPRSHQGSPKARGSIHHRICPYTTHHTPHPPPSVVSGAFDSVVRVSPPRPLYTPPFPLSSDGSRIVGNLFAGLKLWAASAISIRVDHFGFRSSNPHQRGAKKRRRFQRRDSKEEEKKKRECVKGKKGVTIRTWADLPFSHIYLSVMYIQVARLGLH